MQTAEITLSPEEIASLEGMAAREHGSGPGGLAERILREVNSARLRHMESVAVFLAHMDSSQIDEDLKRKIRQTCEDYVRQEQGRVTFRMSLTPTDMDAARVAMGVSGISIALLGDAGGEKKAGLLSAEHA